MNKYIKMFMDDNNLKEGEKFELIAKETKCPIFDGLYFEDGTLKKNGTECLQCWLAMVMSDKYEVEKLKKEPWKPKITEDYYFVSFDWGVVKGESNNNWEFDRFVIAHNLVFQTVGEARDYKWFLDKVDEYKKPFKYRDDNFCFYYDHDDNELSKISLKHICYQGTIFFGDFGNIEKFLEEVGEERIKKYWFNIWE